MRAAHSRIADCMPAEQQVQPGVDHARVRVAGGTLNVALAGAGPPLILLHGWTLDHRVWAPQIMALGAHHRLVMPDRRGFGQSTAPPDLARECDDIDALADALALSRFAIAGMSQAGVITLAYASARPERVVAAITLGSPLAGTVPGGDQLDRDRWAAMVRDGRIAEVRSQWLLHPLLQSASTQGRRLLEQIVSDYDGRDLLSPSRLPTVSATQLHGLAMPLLAIVGAQDSSWRHDVARALGQMVPAGSVAQIAGAGHLANLCQPDRFNTLVHEFLLPFEKE